MCLLMLLIYVPIINNFNSQDAGSLVKRLQTFPVLQRKCLKGVGPTVF